jgi:transketolase
MNHHTYVIASDGDLMEGVSHESCALAGHLGLGKLIVLYDNNQISIDGSTAMTFTEDVLKRFDAYGWHTQTVDGLNAAEVETAIRAAEAETTRPSLISCRTVIGYGSPNKAGTAGVHGSPLGKDEISLTKKQLGWPVEPEFYIPDEVAAQTRTCLENGKKWQSDWEKLLKDYQKAHPDLYEEFSRVISSDLPTGWDADLPVFSPGSSLATRSASGAMLNAISPRIPQLIGGSADLTPSNNTLPKNETSLTGDDFRGRYIRFGVREHGMAAIMSGMALHGGLIPYGGTFLVFSDYMRPGIRLAALMEQQVIYVFTHDSIGLGEDGPTHQPIEHLNALRVIPNLVIFRPADAPETAEGWKIALNRKDGPTALILTRQKLPVLDREKEGYTPAPEAAKGAYPVLPREHPDVLLLASGSEVPLVLDAEKILRQKGVNAQVVSMPSFEIFDRQPEDYQKSVLPPDVTARVAVEAGSTPGWHKYVGMKGEIVGIDRFGASAPYEEIYREFGLTPEAIAEAALRSIEKVKR